MAYSPVPRAGMPTPFDQGHDEALIVQMCHFGQCVTYEPGPQHPACVPNQDPPVQFEQWGIFEWRAAMETVGDEIMEVRRPYLGLRAADFTQAGPLALPVQNCRFTIADAWFQVSKVEEEDNGYVECHLTKWIQTASITVTSV